MLRIELFRSPDVHFAPCFWGLVSLKTAFKRNLLKCYGKFNQMFSGWYSKLYKIKKNNIITTYRKIFNNRKAQTFLYVALSSEALPVNHARAYVENWSCPRVMFFPQNFNSLLCSNRALNKNIWDQQGQVLYLSSLFGYRTDCNSEFYVQYIIFRYTFQLDKITTFSFTTTFILRLMSKREGTVIVSY